MRVERSEHAVDRRFRKSAGVLGRIAGVIPADNAESFREVRSYLPRVRNRLPGGRCIGFWGRSRNGLAFRDPEKAAVRLRGLRGGRNGQQSDAGRGREANSPETFFRTHKSPPRRHAGGEFL